MRLRESESAKYDAAYFETEYWKEDLPGQVGNRGLSYDDPVHRNRFDFLYKKIVPSECSGTILDAGCGPGYFLERAIQGGKDAFGCDLSIAAKALYEKRMPVDVHYRFKHCPLSRLPFSARTFSLTICLDVLEHILLFDVFAAVSELCRVTDYRIILSINLDNPYSFHPTILSRETWICLFELEGTFVFQEHLSLSMQDSIVCKFPEYDLFVFDRARQ
jgi:SAM-dependent methyltransferase